jgi:hypothetical protein
VSWIWIDGADDDTLNSAANDCFGTWTGATSGRAGLERDEQCRSARNAFLETRETLEFGMRSSRLSMMAARNNFATLHQDRAHSRIWAGVTKAFACFAQPCAHETLVSSQRRHIAWIKGHRSCRKPQTENDAELCQKRSMSSHAKSLCRKIDTCWCGKPRTGNRSAVSFCAEFNSPPDVGELA